ncbi:MAG: ABC transporter permease [Lachnospiraceae bacterium]|nr:ABC transporter permease [Lachnospiraceae bacterium]
MLCKLSMKNIRKSMKDYAIYFFTLIVGVAIFYVFNAIETQTVMLSVTSSTKELIAMMVDMLNIVSVFVSFVLGFLIIYASRFLMTRRNKEFALYLLMGMGKRKISMILFIETLLVGCISLAVGLLVGTGISQVMSVFVAQMFEADMESFQFVFSVDACKKTVLYFGIMYVFVMAFNTFMIGKCKLIDLLQASKKSETVKMKNPWVCIVVFVVAAIALGHAYYQVTATVLQLSRMELITAVITGIVSTFLLFWSVSGLVLKLVMSFKNTYFKGLNSFTLRQISSKVNTTVFSMTITCLMLFMTICVLSSCLSLKDSMNASINELVPVDVALNVQLDYSEGYGTGYPSNYNEKMIENVGHTARELYAMAGIDLASHMSEYIEVNTYSSADLTLEDSLGDYLEVAKEQYQFMVFNTREKIISLSDYNKVARMYGNEEFTLADDEYVMVADFDNMVKIRNAALFEQLPLDVFGYGLKSKYQECKEGFIELANTHINIGIMVVPDYVVEGKTPVSSVLIGNYDAKSKADKVEIENMLIGTRSNYIEEWPYVSIQTRLDMTQAAVGTGAMLSFIGLYLGIIFLISSAAIFALKELTESADNIERFRMLRKLGADEKMINSALFKQIGIFFAFPLVLACIHSVFGIQFCNFMLSTFGGEHLLAPIITTAAIIVAIYGGYFVITYLCSKNMIRER